MWLLVLVFLNTMPGFEHITVIERHATYEACHTERNRVGFEMAAAYPYARDFVIECRMSRQKDGA